MSSSIYGESLVNLMLKNEKGDKISIQYLCNCAHINDQNYIMGYY